MYGRWFFFDRLAVHGEREREREVFKTHDKTRALSSSGLLSKPATIRVHMQLPNQWFRHNATHHTELALLLRVAHSLAARSSGQPRPEASCRNRRCADMQILRVLRSGVHRHVDHTCKSRIGRASLSGNGFPIERSPNKPCRDNASLARHGVACKTTVGHLLWMPEWIVVLP